MGERLSDNKLAVIHGGSSAFAAMRAVARRSFVEQELERVLAAVANAESVFKQVNGLSA